MYSTNIYSMGMAIPKVAPENKVCLTVEETCAIFGIGEHTIRRLIKSNPHEDFLLWINKKVLIKRQKFESFILDNVSEL